MLTPAAILAFWLPFQAAEFDQGVPAGSCGAAEFHPVESTLTNPPRIRGRTVSVPRLKLRFSHEDRASALANRQVFVCYDWSWFRYPYSETLFGGWDVSSECRRCRLDSTGSLDVESHRLTPRGWYDGWLRWGRAPRFNGVRFGLQLDSYSYSFSHLDMNQIERLQQGKMNAQEFESGPIGLRVTLDEDRRP